MIWEKGFQSGANQAEDNKGLSGQHIALGCSCSMSGMSVTLEDFELDIADYLWAEGERLGQKAVVCFLLLPGPISEQKEVIRGILNRLENVGLVG